MLRVAIALLLLSTGWNGSAGSIVALGPNPVAHEDRGEYIVLAFREPTGLGTWSLADGETVVGLPNRTVAGRVVVTEEPAAVAPWVDPPVVALDGRLALANAGETVQLRRSGVTVDRVTYRDAPEGHRYVRTTGQWRWRREGRTDRPVVRAGPTMARVFALPDAPNATNRALASADRRIRLGAYTFASDRTTKLLCRAHRSGVDVAVLVDGGPVGGLSAAAASALDQLTACGVSVTVLGGPYERFAFHHAKYAVIDDRALVMTENWKPSGAGGRSNRGWGVVVESPAVASALAATFRADVGWRDAIPWDAYRTDRTFESFGQANGTYRAVHPPETVAVSNVTVLVTPDNAEPALVGLFANATESIVVQQISLGRPGNPLVRAVLRAARRGVRVRLLLSGAWYVREENRAVAGVIESIAAEEDLPVTVRLADPGPRFGKLHSKGIVVDDVAVVGSINWNNNSLRENREVALVLRSDGAAAYYRSVFLGDWRGGRWLLPVGLVVVVVGAVGGAAGWAWRSFEFAATSLDRTDPDGTVVTGEAET